MLNNYRDIFSVTRGDYKNFVQEIKPEFRDVQTIELNNYTTATKIFSKKTGKCLCSRVTYSERKKGEERIPEKYYIFELPDNEERQEVVPKVQVVLETPEQVQKFLDALKKMKEEQND